MVFLIISHGYILRLIFLVYYRVSTYDGAIPSNSAAYLNDRYLGRIGVEQMALPRTVKSLKRCIAAVEGIANHGRITLYTSATTEKTHGRPESDHIGLWPWIDARRTYDFGIRRV